MEMNLVEIGDKDKSMQLTQKARAIIDRFEKLEKEVENLLHTADNDFQKLIRSSGK
jgi:molybdenum-dependent DNA-binding transcriptional regulator ModE